MRFKVVEALAARGRADVALDVLRARRPGTEGTSSLAEAEAALSIRLECNLITEAYMEVCDSFLRTRIYFYMQHCAFSAASAYLHD